MAAAGSESGSGPATGDPKSPNASLADPEKPPAQVSSNAADEPPAEPPAQKGADEQPAKQTPQQENPPATSMATELDEFGLPIRPYVAPSPPASEGGQPGEEESRGRRGSVSSRDPNKPTHPAEQSATKDTDDQDGSQKESADSDAEFVDAVDTQAEDNAEGPATSEALASQQPAQSEPAETPSTSGHTGAAASKPGPEAATPDTPGADASKLEPESATPDTSGADVSKAEPETVAPPSTSGADAATPAPEAATPDTSAAVEGPSGISHQRMSSKSEKKGSAEFTHQRATSKSEKMRPSEFSHQRAASKSEKEEEKEEEPDWQEMPAYARYDMYDDDDKLIAREHNDEAEEKMAYGGLGGAGKGYTRVVMDDDVESATSMDENTQYLFKEVNSTSMMDENDEQRDAVSQLQATKDLLTEGQRIAYVGVVRLELHAMVKEMEDIEHTRKTKKWVSFAAEAMKMFSQKMMIRLYAHMEISQAEQVMIEQLAEHGVLPTDLTPILMANSRVNNPMAENAPRSSAGDRSSAPTPSPTTPDQEVAAEPPPPYQETEAEDLPDVRTPSQLPSSSKLDIDLRWTVLCDLFLMLIADSTYDARSRCLLERVAKAIEIPWIDICRFEKRVTDALEMQQAAEQENWNEDEHMEERRKMALKRRYVMMGLATVGGGLVIGLSAGLLAPMIGAGLAAGFTTIGVSGTGSFLAGAGGAAVITSSAAASGSLIGGRAANRRTGAVRTFEYRPLHNNKRVNLILTVSGWMTGKVDDVRLPYSTVDSVMGDIYSVLWEPELLRSMGDTINLLATEVSSTWRRPDSWRHGLTPFRLLPKAYSRYSATPSSCPSWPRCSCPSCSRSCRISLTTPGPCLSTEPPQPA